MVYVVFVCGEGAYKNWKIKRVFFKYQHPSPKKQNKTQQKKKK